jgi:hypothetical protein
MCLPERTVLAARARRKKHQVSSLVGADGPLVLHEAMPFSMADVDEYISLRPRVWPFAAVRTK